MLKRLLPVQISDLGNDEVEVIMSTGSIARDGHILVPQGARLNSYRANPIVLFQHDANIPVARASELRVNGDNITAKITFAPAGVSAKADEVRGLVKSGIINAVSVGFDPIEGEPIDPKRPYGGKRFTDWELLECSWVSVPADTGAVVTARENERGEMTETRAAIFTRGLYEVADLAALLASAGYLHSWLDYCKSEEGDGSDIPDRFLAVLKDLGAILVDMTAEEVGEMFSGGEAGERAQLRNARAAKKLTQAQKDAIETAIAHHTSGAAAHDEGLRCLRAMCRDDDGEMAHEPAATREVPAAPALELVPAVLTVETGVTPEQREAFAARLRKLQRTGPLQNRYAEAAD
jgi:HK97 family phage prohead protease